MSERSADATPSAGTLRRWRDEPRALRRALVGILAVAALLTAWNLGRTGDFEFYGSAARSMSTSWRAFVFGAYDPAATVTLDKLSGFLVPQALSARLFGFSWASIALPQVLEGLVTIWVCATVALRLLSARAGLIAAGAAATTPILVSMFGRPMEDGLLTMSLAVALLWWQRAVIARTVWPLLVSGAFVGVGFQAKMLAAWLVLPALSGALLVGLRPLRRALLGAAAVIGAAVVTSIAWMSVVQLVPASARPWFDGSIGNDVFSTVFGYNGLDRLLSMHAPSRFGGPAAIDTGRLLHSIPLTGAVSQQTSPIKLLLPYYTTQVGWLYPLAIAGLVLGAIRWVRHRRAGDRAGAALFTAVVAWLVVVAAVLSRSALAHTAYVASIAVQLVLLSTVAVEEGLRLLASPAPRARLVLPAVAVVEGVWGAVLTVPDRSPVPLTAAFALLALGGVVAALLAPRRVPGSRARMLAATIACVGLLAGPLCWSLQAVDPDRAGTGGDAYVGPKTFLAGTVTAAPGWAPRFPAPWGGEPRLNGPLAEVVAMTRSAAGDDPDRPMFAASSERFSAVVLEATGREVLTDGGYSGGVPVLTVAQLRGLVRAGDLRWLVTFLHAPRRDAVDRFAIAGHCRIVHRWRPDRDSRVLDHGLALWRCTQAEASTAIR